MLFCDALGSALMATPLVMWLRDMRCVLRGTLSLRPEDAPPATSAECLAIGSATAPHLGLLALGGATHPRSASAAWRPVRGCRATVRGVGLRSPLIGARLTSPQAVFYSAVVTWLLPSGYLAGYHFRILGRPLDYQVPCMRKW